VSDERRDDDDQGLLDLASTAVRLDPLPVDVLMAAHACFQWRSIDEELADLVFDSALLGSQLVGVRSAGGARQLAFEASELVVEVEVDLEAEPQLMGQLVPSGPAEIEIRSLDSSVRVAADGLGRFWANGLVRGPMSLRITPSRLGQEPASTAWVTIGATT